MTKWLAPFLLCLASAPISWSQSRSLEWRSLDVQARLDSDGRLHVRERQAMVFSGDWNGGERAFRLSWGQRLDLNLMGREDMISHSMIPLSRGDLSRVDEYDWHDSRTLRWRSRLPSDPPFQDTELVYVLDYTLSNVLIPQADGTFVLDHDFAFPDREGPILEFFLDLTFDSAWSPMEDFSGEVRRGVLDPGESVVITLPLEYRGESSPSGVRFGTSRTVRGFLGVAFAFGVAIIGFLFYREEDALGRFAPLTPLSVIDQSWLDENVFAMLPEEVGAAWDDTTAGPEVAAVLARMVSEKKLASEVYRKKNWFTSEEHLKLKLLVGRGSLSGYEKTLVSALFFSGDETTTEKIRKHYQSRGFDPASKIEGPLKQRVKRLLGIGKTQREISKKPTMLLLLGSAMFLVASLWDLLTVLPGMAFGLFVYVLGLGAAVLYRKRVKKLFAYATTFLAPAALLVMGVAFYLVVDPARSALSALVALVLFHLALLTSLFNLAKFRDGASAIVVRKKLASARKYFALELDKPAPSLKDEWFPYLLAFELGPNVDRWFGSYGAAGASSTSGFASTSSSGSSGSSSWTGGGGTFGGAGATGSWAAAVGSVAAVVSEPGSSSSGGGGGGGGGSSGGGGGGGW